MLTITLVGTFAGVQLLIGTAFAQQWLSLSGSQLVEQFPMHWIYIATFVIPLALIQTFCISVAIFMTRQMPDVKKFWWACLICWLLNCTITATYHLPVVLNTLDLAYAAPDVKAVIERWLYAHRFRILLGIGAFACALLALTNTQNQIIEQEPL